MIRCKPMRVRSRGAPGGGTGRDCPGCGLRFNPARRSVERCDRCIALAKKRPAAPPSPELAAAFAENFRLQVEMKQKLEALGHTLNIQSRTLNMQIGRTIVTFHKTSGMGKSEHQITDSARMRAYLLERLREDLYLGGADEGDLIAALSPLPADDEWRHHGDVAEPAPDGWYLWRDPDDREARIHADQAIVEDGQIVSKWGCGIDFYSDCAPLDMPADVAAVLAEHRAQKEAAHG